MTSIKMTVIPKTINQICKPESTFLGGYVGPAVMLKTADGFLYTVAVHVGSCPHCFKSNTYSVPVCTWQLTLVIEGVAVHFIWVCN